MRFVRIRCVLDGTTGLMGIGSPRSAPWLGTCWMHATNPLPIPASMDLG